MKTKGLGRIKRTHGDQDLLNLVQGDLMYYYNPW